MQESLDSSWKTYHISWQNISSNVWNDSAKSRTEETLFRRWRLSPPCLFLNLPCICAHVAWRVSASCLYAVRQKTSMSWLQRPYSPTLSAPLVEEWSDWSPFRRRYRNTATTTAIIAVMVVPMMRAPLLVWGMGRSSVETEGTLSVQSCDSCLRV